MPDYPSRAFNAGQAILSVADRGLVAALGENHDITEFFSLAKPPTDNCNYMAVWVTTQFITDTFPDRPASFTRPRLYVRCGIRAAEMTLRCHISCWGKAQYPDYRDVEEKSQIVTGIGEAVFDALIEAESAHELLPNKGFMVALYDLTFLEPEGGCAGFDIKMVVQLANANCR